jgi:hypothetical protein
VTDEPQGAADRHHEGHSDGSRDRRVPTQDDGPAVPQDVRDGAGQASDRKQTPIDVFGHIGDEDINRDLIDREPRRSGM